MSARFRNLAYGAQKDTGSSKSAKTRASGILI